MTSVGGTNYDAVVIGGGIAGVVAARDLTEQGNRVLLLEARDRLGGRTWSTTFPGTDINVEMGGQFVIPDLWPLLMAEIERYGVELQHLPVAQSFPTVFGGHRHPGPFPIPLEQIMDLERAALHLIKAAMRIEPGVPLDHQGLEDLDISMAEFLAPLELPAETYDLVTTITAMYSFRYPDEISALHVLNALACMHLSVFELYGAVDAHIRTASLVEAIAAEVTEVRVDCSVATVDQTGADVIVTTAAGEVITASAVVVAVPLNVWNDIEFVPALSEVKRASSEEKHGTDRSGKVWVRTRNADPCPYVFAAPASNDGALMLYTHDEFDNGDQLMGIFAVTSHEGDDYHLDLDETESVERVLQKLQPGAELVESLTHNYNTDPYSKGDWIAWRPGRVSRSHSTLSAPEGRVAFAGADIAPKWMMVFEGAVESGHLAAEQSRAHLTQRREVAASAAP